MTAIAESAPDVATGPQERVDAWLAKFEAALAARDVAAAADLFEPGGFWRDLVSFTWNLHTSEGRDQIAAMLTERLDGTAPSGFATTDPASGDDVAEAFIGFETGVDKVDLRPFYNAATDSFAITTWGAFTLLSVDLGADGTIDTQIAFSGNAVVTGGDLLLS